MRKDIKTILATCQRIILLCVICMILPTGLMAQKKGISTERVQFEGRGIDRQAESDAQARRVDMIGLAFISAPTVAVKTAEPAASNNPMESEIIQEDNKQTFVPSRWYIGIGGGVSLSRSTFCSFAMDGTRPGFNVGVLGGYKINKLLSAELSLDYTRMDLRTYDCCQLLWLAADGNRYAAPVAGIKNYAYNDLRSVTHLFGLGAHLNIDLVSLWNENSRWSALVSPAIYGIYSSANLKQLSTGANVTDATSFHFGVGADLGVGYQFTDCFGLRLTTGINYLTGKGIDGFPQEEHKTNYVWNTFLKLIFKL